MSVSNIDHISIYTIVKVFDNNNDLGGVVIANDDNTKIFDFKDIEIELLKQESWKLKIMLKFNKIKNLVYESPGFEWHSESITWADSTLDESLDIKLTEQEGWCNRLVEIADKLRIPEVRNYKHSYIFVDKPLEVEIVDKPLEVEIVDKPLEVEIVDKPLKDEIVDIPLEDEIVDIPLEDEIDLNSER